MKKIICNDEIGINFDCMGFVITGVVYDEIKQLLTVYCEYRNNNIKLAFVNPELCDKVDRMQAVGKTIFSINCRENNCYEVNNFYSTDTSDPIFTIKAKQVYYEAPDIL